MPSTYSSLKVQLMATGENNTTWGDVTNVNLGTALEEAIVGSADVAFSNANVTLTLTDTNASQTARNMRLNLTGTATAGYNLVVPSIEKPYIINNGTDGTITVKNATGTGIAVPAGKTMWVYNDGTNVVDAVTRLSSLTLGTALVVGSGGTGANTFTSNGVLLGNGTSAISATAAGTTGQVLVGNTGSAPSWATLSGIGVTSFSAGTTGFTPSTGTTGAVTLAGTLNVANGGTGATSLTSGYLVKGNGTSAASASVVYDDGTNVGIGTTSPGAKLDVNGQARASTLYATSASASSFVSRLTNQDFQLYATNGVATGNSGDVKATIGLYYADTLANLNGGIQFTRGGSGTDGWMNFLTSGSERMRIDSSGNLGIGTSSPGAKLAVASGNIRLDNNQGLEWGGGNNYIFGNETTDIVGIATNGSERMRIDSSGNLGLGVTPSAWINSYRAFNIGDSGLISSRTGASINNVEVGVNWFRNSGGSFVYKANGYGTNYQQFDGAHYWYTAPSGTAGTAITFTQAMTLDASGNLGIGTSGQPDKLFVYANTASSALAVRNDGGGPLQTWATFGTERMRITSGGDVLVGKTAASVGTDGVQLLATGYSGFSAAGTTALFLNRNTNDGTLLEFGRNGVSAATMGLASSALTFGTAGSERMRITSAGNVGIGTSSPARPLDVNGTVRISDGAAVEWGGVSAYISGTSASNALLFATSSAEAMRITSSGNVGIGTSSPNNRLQSAYSVPAGVPAAGAGAHGLAVGSAGFGLAAGALTSGNAYLQATRWDGSATNYDLLLQPNGGNVGIGTSSPGYNLEVAGAVRASIAVRGNYAGGTDIGHLRYLNANGSQVADIFAENTNGGASDSAALNFSTTSAGTSAVKMKLDASGNLGLGITTVASGFKMQVNGSVLATAYSFGQTNQHLIYDPSSTEIGFRIGTSGPYYGIGTTGSNNMRINSASGGDMLFSVSGSEYMRISYLGNVGIGTSSPSQKLTLQGAQLTIPAAGWSSGQVAYNYLGDTNGGIRATNGGNVGVFAYNGFDVTVNGVTPVTAMTVTSGANVGIGTSSPNYKVDVQTAANAEVVSRVGSPAGSSAASTMLLTTGTTNSYAFMKLTDNSGSPYFTIGSGSPVSVAYYNFPTHIWTDQATERMRLTSSGNLLVGTTTVGGANGLSVDVVGIEGASVVVWNRTSRTTTSFPAVFRNGGSDVGYISYNNSGVTYSTTSDARLKHDIVDAPDASDLIDAIKVRSFKWNADNSEQRYGMVAQELLEVAPEAVSVPADEEAMMGVDYSKLVPMLIKEVQSLRARVAQLEGK